jgi:DNA sulfur modification protein DndD
MLEAEIEQVNKQILKLCENLLPFTFAPQYCASLRKRLIEEDQRQASLMAAKQVKKTLLAVEKKTITSLKRLDLTRKERRKLILRIDQIFQDAMPVAVRRKNGSIKLIHHLSDVEQRKLLGWIDEALNKVPVKIRELTMESERLTLELQKSSDLLNKAPDDEVIAPIFKELSALNRDIGNIEATINANREKVSQTDFKLNLVNSRLRKLEKERRKHASLVRGLALANRLQDALEEYERRLKKEKLEQLSESLLDCLNGLMHKEIFQKVSIDPESFSVTLFDKGNNPVPKDQLSAGEKQIYAIATLWALARTSGRPLPFIVDTPLGRLDSDHRLNLVQNFFPVASHQVIIFSTDTEIDQRYFEELSDYISHSYKLEYEPSKGETKVREGYFWRMNERQEIVANELQ